MKNIIRFLMTAAALCASVFLLQISASAETSVVGIEITKMPDKTVYDMTEDAVLRSETVWSEEENAPVITPYNYYPVDFTGMVVTLHMSDESEVTIDYNTDGLTKKIGEETVVVENNTEQDVLHPWEEGRHTVFLQCGTVAVDFEILLTHDSVTGLSIAKLPDKTRYLAADGVRMAVFDGEKVKTFTHYPVDLTGLELFVHYEDGSTQRIAVSDSSRTLLGDAVISDDGQTAGTAWKEYGTHPVTLTWRDKSVTFNVCTDTDEHKVTAWTSNGNATHTGVCTYCGEKLTASCSGGTASCKAEAVCSVCSTKYGEVLPHTWNYTSHDNNGHIGVCTVCGKTLEKEGHALYAGTFNESTGMRTYACSCGYTVNGYGVGDLNLDGEITAEDARTALRCAVGLWGLTDVGKYIADTDHNGSIEAADARLILRAAVGLEDGTQFGVVVMEILK